MPKDEQLPEWNHRILELYFKILVVWRHITNLDTIKKIEREKWPNPDERRKKRIQLRDAKSARMCLLLCLSGEELLLRDFFELFKDKGTEKDPDRLSSDEKRNKYIRNRKKVRAHLIRLEEYNLVKLTGSGDLYKVKAEPLLYECLIEIIPHIEECFKECWNIPDIGGQSGSTRLRETATRPSQPNKRWKHPQLSEIHFRILDMYFKTLLVWRHVANLDMIKKIEREKWPNPYARRQYRNSLRDAKSATICMLLSMSGEDILSKDFVKLFTDKITELVPDKPSNDEKRKERDMNRKMIERTLERLEEYNLVKSISRGKLKTIRAEPFLYQCLIEIIPFIRECWKIPDDELADKH